MKILKWARMNLNKKNDWSITVSKLDSYRCILKKNSNFATVLILQKMKHNEN